MHRTDLGHFEFLHHEVDPAGFIVQYAFSPDFHLSPEVRAVLNKAATKTTGGVLGVKRDFEPSTGLTFALIMDEAVTPDSLDDTLAAFVTNIRQVFKDMKSRPDVASLMAINSPSDAEDKLATRNMR